MLFLPTYIHQESKREEAKEWVLALSMDNQVDQTLPTDERGTYVASLHSPHTDVQSLPCVVTGYPVLRNRIDFKTACRTANKDDWNTLVMAMKVSHGIVAHVNHIHCPRSAWSQLFICITWIFCLHILLLQILWVWLQVWS